MTIFELVGFILAIISLLGPSINVVQFIQAHIRSYLTIEWVIHQHLHFEEQNQRKLQDVRDQLIAYQQSILHTDFQILMDNIVRMQDKLNNMHTVLLHMKRCANDKIRKFMNATKWTRGCRTIECELEDVENKIFFINMWLSNNATVTWEEYVQGLILNNSFTGIGSVGATIRTRTSNFVLLCVRSAVIVGAVLVTTEVIFLRFDQ